MTINDNNSNCGNSNRSSGNKTSVVNNNNNSDAYKINNNITVSAVLMIVSLITVSSSCNSNFTTYDLYHVVDTIYSPDACT